MAELKYKVSLNEAKIDKEGNLIELFEKDLPHHNEMAYDFEKEWALLESIIINTIDGAAKGKVASCTARVKKSADGRSYAMITITPHSGVRWSDSSRNNVFETLDAQMTDGFGESMHMSQITGVADEYRFYL